MISGIHISSSQMVIDRDDVSNKLNLPQLKNNQIVKAKILQLLPNGKTLILINNQKVAAKTTMLLQPGDKINLKVLAQKDATILKLIAPVQQISTKQISSLVNFFAKNAFISDIVESKIPEVKELFYDIALKSEKPDKNFLPRLMEKIGIALESKSNILLELFASNSSPTPEKMQILKAAVSFLETIENLQLLNHQSSDSGRFLLPFPIFGESAFNFGQLLIDTGDKNKDKDKDKVINISFLLNMSRIGALRADFSLLKKEITGRFLLQNDETCDYVKSMIPELKKRLGRIEYKALEIECEVAKKEELQPGSFIETLIKISDDRILNIVI